MSSVFSLLDWCRGVCEGYTDVHISDMSSSFTDGLAFCAIIHKHRPDLLYFYSLSKHKAHENMHLAFSVAERELGIPALLDPGELLCEEEPDLLSIITYVSQLYCVFNGKSQDNESDQKKKAEDHSSRTNKQTLTLLFSSDGISSSDRSVCSVCDTHVHLIQRVLVKGRLYHRSCFRCSVCRRSLLPMSFTEDTETGLLQCSYQCKPDQHSLIQTCVMEKDRKQMIGETDVDRMSEVCLSDSSASHYDQHLENQNTKTYRDGGETYIDIVKTDIDGMSEVSLSDSSEADLCEPSTSASHYDQHLENQSIDTYRDGGETYIDIIKTDVDGMSEVSLSDSSETDIHEPLRSAPQHEERSQNQTTRTDRDRETDVDGKSEGRLSSSSQSDVQDPPKPAPRKKAETHDPPPPPPPRSHDHRPVSSQSAVLKDHPWMKLVNPGPWYRLPPAQAPVYSSRRPVTLNPFLEEEHESIDEEVQRNPFSCETSDARKPQASSAVPIMHQAAAHGFPLIKRKVVSDTHLSEHQVCEEQQKLEERLQDLERRGVQLERDMRRRSDTQSLLVDWFILIHQKNMLVRRDAELMYMLKQQRLEHHQADVEFEIRRLFNKPELDWSEEDRSLEHLLMSRLLSIIQQRSDIISSLDLDRQREQEEDEMLNSVIQRSERLIQTDTQLDKCRWTLKRLQIFKKSSRKTENPNSRKKSNI